MIKSISELTRSECYLSVSAWAKVQQICRDEAERQLDNAVERGLLETVYLYRGSDSPIQFYVSEEDLDKPIRLSEVGYFGDDEDREVIASRFRTTKVYVSVNVPRTLVSFQSCTSILP